MNRTPPLAATLLAFAALALSEAPLEAADWPQIRGVDRNGLSAETDLARAWPNEGPRLLWRQSIGEGFSGVVVVGDRVYTLAADGDQEAAFCLDAATGKTLWKTPVGKYFTEEFGNGPRSTPSVADGKVYVIGSTARLWALDAKTGKPVWDVDLAAAFKANVPGRGYSVSPLVDGDLVVLEVGGEKAIVALDAATGKTRWQAALSGPGGYSSPIRVELGGKVQYVFYRRAAPQLVGISREGEVLWQQAFSETGIAMPVFVAPDQFFFSAAHDETSLLLKVTPGNPATVAEVWRHNRMRNHFNPAVVVNGVIYGFDNATLRAVDAASGEPRWAQRGFGKGSLVSASGLLFVLSDQGTLTLVEADATEYRERGRVQALTGKSWTAPALSSGRLFLRDQDEIACFDVRGAAGNGSAVVR